MNPKHTLTPARLLRLILTAALAGVVLLTAVPTHAQGGPPSSARINGLRHSYQTWNNCGGANLTMALTYYGWTADQDVARAWLKPNVEDKNVGPGEMAGYVNQQTTLPNIRALWRYGGDLALVKRAIAAGFPIIVESGYDVDDLGWMGHYETVVAYNDDVNTLWVFDSYLGPGDDGAGRVHNYTEFEAWWRHFNYTFVLLFPLDREAELRDVLGPYVDPLYGAQTALDRARTQAQADATDGWAWFNMGTSLVRLGNYYDAATAYDEAFRQGMPYRLTWYEFGPFEAYYRVGRYDDVENLVANTQATTIYVEELRYWQGMVYAARGQYDLALNEFNQGLAFNPNSVMIQEAKAAVENGTFVVPGA